MTIKLTAAEVEFIERMGVMTQSDSVPRIAGRMWGLFMVAGDILSFSAVADALQISRGSVSTNARVLENLGVLERRSQPGERQDFFAIREDPYTTLLELTIRRQRDKAAMVRQARKSVTRQVSRAKLAELADFHDALASGMGNSLEQLTGGTSRRRKSTTS